MAKRIMFYCQHLLGMGHLVRSAEIVRALSHDCSVLFVTGGEIPVGFRFPQNIKTFELISLKTDAEFSGLQLCDPSWDLEETKVIRRETLLHAFDVFRPDVLVTELFPFGRKQFSFELLPLLKRARSRVNKPMIVSSIRDILVTRKDQAEYEDRVCQIANDFYDLVLVHGDEETQTLKDTFSRVDDLLCQVVYTGYVVQQGAASVSAIAPEPSHRPTIVVSNGSGKCASGHFLLESVLRAAPLLEKKIPHQFHMFAGPLVDEVVFEDLRQKAEGRRNVTLFRSSQDLPSVLRGADLSISMAGYNTVMEILAEGVRALVYPVTGNKDDEQSLRAGKLEAKGALRVLDEQQLDPAILAQRIQDALLTEPRRIRFNNEGATNSALLIKKHLAMRNEAMACSSSVPNGRPVYAPAWASI